MNEVTKKRLFILNNLFIFITTVITVTVTLTLGSWAARKDGGPFAYWQHIVTFTILSNIFLGIVSLIAACIGLSNFKSGKALPKQLFTWYLIASSSAMLTCITVLFFLAPTRAASGKDYFDMILGPMFFLHFFNPILSAITYIFLSGNKKATLNDRLLAIIPPVLYAAPYIICVVFLRVWPDFYGLTFGGKDYLLFVVLAVFLILIFSISSLLAFLHNRFAVQKYDGVHK